MGMTVGVLCACSIILGESCGLWFVSCDGRIVLSMTSRLQLVVALTWWGRSVLTPKTGRGSDMVEVFARRGTPSSALLYSSVSKAARLIQNYASSVKKPHLHVQVFELACDCMYRPGPQKFHKAAPCAIMAATRSQNRSARRPRADAEKEG